MAERKENPIETETYEVRRPRQPVRWRVEVPGSKSITNRALALAALADGTVVLEGVQFGDDAETFLEALRALGFSVRTDEEKQRVSVEGCGGRIPCSGAEICVGSAGTAARFLTAMLGVSGGTWRIRASEQMEKRPMRPLFEALLSLGARITWLGEEWHLPVDLAGAAKCTGSPGEENPAELDLDISESTQFLSALLLAAPLLPGGMRIHITSEKKSGPYVDMTREMMRRFGVTACFGEAEPVSAPPCDYEVRGGQTYARSGSYRVEPDVSAACYFYAAAAVTGGTVQVNGVSSRGMQGDLRFLEVLRQMGCEVADEPGGLTVKGPGPGKLNGICVDMRDFSDQALTLAAIAPYADGPVQITGIAHVRRQESDRIAAIVDNLRRAGVPCEELPDGVRIEPKTPRPCTIETFEDHRVAMAFAVMGLGADGIVIKDPACCSKTFPDYFKQLDILTQEKGDER